MSGKDEEAALKKLGVIEETEKENTHGKSGGTFVEPCIVEAEEKGLVKILVHNKSPKMLTLEIGEKIAKAEMVETIFEPEKTETKTGLSCCRY
ncbi:hypothetical protein niasHT_040163 [Heterodera trifolii]|uniref:Uncharacterized protein n=1 Tax=Heterodera trifolii TaxID=157864 RepID=A0ABD2ICT5_9BILA